MNMWNAAVALLESFNTELFIQRLNRFNARFQLLEWIIFFAALFLYLTEECFWKRTIQLEQQQKKKLIFLHLNRRFFDPGRMPFIRESMEKMRLIICLMIFQLALDEWSNWEEMNIFIYISVSLVELNFEHCMWNDQFPKYKSTWMQLIIVLIAIIQFIANYFFLSFLWCW